MPKIKIKVTIKNSEEKVSYNTNAIITNDVIKYQEEDFTKVKFDYKNKKLIRENDNMKMAYYFDNIKESNILIKEYGRSIKLFVKTNKLEKKDNNYEVEYMLDKDKFKYRIEEVK